MTVQEQISIINRYIDYKERMVMHIALYFLKSCKKYIVAYNGFRQEELEKMYKRKNLDDYVSKTPQGALEKWDDYVSKTPQGALEKWKASFRSFYVPSISEMQLLLEIAGK